MTYGQFLRKTIRQGYCCRYYTAHLNEINSGLTFARALKAIGNREKIERIVKAMDEIEKQGVFNEFIWICLLDMTIIYRNALAAVHVWDELYNLRQGYLLIYEAIRTYHMHSRSIKGMAEKTSSKALSDFNILSQRLKNFKKDFGYGGVISECRNNTIGHIESDPGKFFTIMSKFDTDQAFAALKEFMMLVAAMGNLADSIHRNYTKAIMKEISFDKFFHRDMKIEIEHLMEIMDNGKDQLNEDDIGYFKKGN